jgi:ATP-dependent RNA helicase DDX18/HAS1
MGDGIAKKRKRNGAEAVDATAVSKTTKKVKNPPQIEPEEEEDEILENDSEEEEEDVENAAEESEADDADDDNGDDIVGDLPTDGAPILPPTADSEMFDQLKLSEKTMMAISEMGFTKMTAIQKTVCGSMFSTKLGHWQNFGMQD